MKLQYLGYVSYTFIKKSPVFCRHIHDKAVYIRHTSTNICMFTCSYTCQQNIYGMTLLWINPWTWDGWLAYFGTMWKSLPSMCKTTLPYFLIMCGVHHLEHFRRTVATQLSPKFVVSSTTRLYDRIKRDTAMYTGFKVLCWPLFQIRDFVYAYTRVIIPSIVHCIFQNGKSSHMQWYSKPRRDTRISPCIKEYYSVTCLLL